jgi:hypothetical protein
MPGELEVEYVECPTPKVLRKLEKTHPRSDSPKQKTLALYCSNRLRWDPHSYDRFAACGMAFGIAWPGMSGHVTVLMQVSRCQHNSGLTVGSDHHPPHAEK